MGIFIAIGSLALLTAPAYAAPRDQTSGSAAFLCGEVNGCGGEANFTAQGTPADPQGNVRIRQFHQLVDSRGSVDCVAVDGNRATISGRLENPSPATDGPIYAILIEDNGSPGSGGVNPDRMHIAYGRFPVDCTLGNLFPPAFPVARGNVVVKDNTP
jgi:hypothetical protein